MTSTVLETLVHELLRRVPYIRTQTGNNTCVHPTNFGTQWNATFSPNPLELIPQKLYIDICNNVKAPKHNELSERN